MRSFIKLILFLAIQLILVVAVAPSVRADPHRGLAPLTSPMDRSTPRRAMQAFLDAAERADYERAAYVLDLRDVPPPERTKKGASLARSLHGVLQRKLWIDPTELSDEPEGTRTDGATPGRLGVITLPSRVDVPITMARVPIGREQAWLVSNTSVKAIPELDGAYGVSEVEARLPKWLAERYLGPLAAWQWLGLVLGLPAGYAFGAVVAALFRRFAARLARKTRARWDEAAVEALYRPCRVIGGLFVLRAIIEALRLPAPVEEVFTRWLAILVIAAITWAVYRVVTAVAHAIEEDVSATSEDGRLSVSSDLRARGIRTRLSVLLRVAHILVVFVGAALVLLQFDAVRSVGVSLLASAGVAGVVLGFAAQKSLGTLLAGIQLSLTQPIRIGDDVVIEGEFGTIEEIFLTYVVVKIWDQRRLVVPMTRFLDQPFQNWTKVSAQLLGTVILYADYTVPVPRVREELDRLIAGSPLWDGRAKNVQVTDVTDRTLQLRVLLSARNAGELWDLRVLVRENLVAFLRDFENGRYLPKTRIEEGRQSEPDRVAAQ